jgi:hypothetical protein
MNKHKHSKTCKKKSCCCLFNLILLCSTFSGAKENKGSLLILKNNFLKLSILSPKSEVYKGARFDYSGMIYQIATKNHSFLPGELKKDNTQDNSYIPLGIIDEFGIGMNGLSSPPGYNKTPKNGSFIKIGVGLLKKETDEAYNFKHGYTILKRGKWFFSKKETAIAFTQKFISPDGWGYLYKKEIQLCDNKSAFVIKYSLKNIGEKKIKTNHYSHNFISIDKYPIGKSYLIKFIFPLKFLKNRENILETCGNKIIFLKNLTKSGIWNEIKGYSNNFKQNQFYIENTFKNAGIKIACNQTIHKLHLWITQKAIAPESFINIEIKPQEIKNWESYYEVYNIKQIQKR